MRIIKNINHNYAVALDNNGNQVVLSGKGLGFGEIPREINDLSAINATFYNIDENYISMFNDIPEEIIDISNNVINKVKMNLNVALSANIVLTLADHINFTIERYKNNMRINLPVVSDIEYLCENEYKAGIYALKLIKKQFGLWLPNEEAVYIALHILNSEAKAKNDIQDDELIDIIIKIVENDLDFTVNRKNFNYSRFVSHLIFLFKRGRTNHILQTDNIKLYKEMIRQFPESSECAEDIAAYLKNQKQLELSEEEKLYLILHINRLYSREDRN